MNASAIETVDTAERTSSITLQEAAEFLWAEAEMLDRHDYKQWLALWTDEGRYVIPIEQGEGVDPAGVLNIAFDDAQMREARVRRLRSGFAISSAPSARTARTVSRFVVVSREDGVLTVRAVQQIVEFKFERTRILASEMLYRLIRREKGIALAHKEVHLINSDDALWGIGYLL